jgi:hypothetical protein
MMQRTSCRLAAVTIAGAIWFGSETPGAGQAPADLPSKAGNANSFANLNPLQAVPPGPTPRSADGRVDFSGLWRPADVFLIEDISLGLKSGETVPLKPGAAKLMSARSSKDDPEANCLPTGVPRLAPYPWRIVETPTHMFFLFEGNIHSYRQIFMDGRKHPPDPDPTWYGHSIGRREGDALVVDTVGFNDKFWFDFVGHPHTEQLHTVERYRRTGLGTLREEVTIDDPGAYTRPFTVSGSHRLLLHDELMEYVCQENERDTKHLSGPATRP